jgi:hypothetical protein
MTNRRRSATTRSVPAQTPEQLLELTQGHICPLIGLIDRLSEAGAEDELRVISKQLTRLSDGGNCWSRSSAARLRGRSRCARSKRPICLSHARLARRARVSTA